MQIFQRNKNNSTWCKSFNVIQIIQCCTNDSTLYKLFNVVQINQRNTNNSILYKLFSGNHSICYKKHNKIFKWKAIWYFHKYENIKLQPITKYLRLTLVSMYIGALWEKLYFFFSRIFCKNWQIFIVAGRLDTRISFYEVYTISWHFLIL